MTDSERNPLGGLRDLDVGCAPPIHEVRARHDRTVRRHRRARVAVGSMVAFALVGLGALLTTGERDSAVESVDVVSTVVEPDPDVPTTPTPTSTPIPTTVPDLTAVPRVADAPSVDDPSTCGVGAFLSVDDPTPCYRTRGDVPLILRNDSGRTVPIDLGGVMLQLLDGGWENIGGIPISQFLSVGVHHLGDGLPALWVVDRADSPFAAITEITPLSFGPLRPNMTVTEAAAALGVDLVDAYPDLRDDLAGCTFVRVDGAPDPYAPDLQVLFDEDLGAGLIVRIETSDSAVATPQGVRPGSTESELFAAYGDQLVSQPGGDFPSYTLVPDEAADADFSLGFALTPEPGRTEPVVSSILVATDEAVGFSEGCL